MTLIEKAVKIAMQKPEYMQDMIKEHYCPHDFGLEPEDISKEDCSENGFNCDKCWEMECCGNPAKAEAQKETKIKDSGARREFESGAVRDIEEGKGRCDLLPLGVVAECMENGYVIECIDEYMRTRDVAYLQYALAQFCVERRWDYYTMPLEVSVQFEEGAKKYGERNWEAGIPLHSFIDSAVRHYLKWKRGDEDERHDRAFCWNILCAMWTAENRPECDDLPNKEGV